MEKDIEFHAKDIELKINVHSVRTLSNILMLVCDSEPNDETTTDDNMFCLCGRRLNMVLVDDKFPMMEFIKVVYESQIESLRDDFNHVELHYLIKLFADCADPELHLDPEDLAVRLMYVGHYVGIWNVIDPYKELDQIDQYMKEMICASIWAYILIEPNYIKYILDMK